MERELPFNTPFLKYVAEDLLSRFGHNLSQLCVVFPNKRARLFFSHFLGEASGGKTIWAPSYRTVTELFQELSDLTLSDRLQLILQLYSIYSEITGSSDNLDDFYYYGEILLSDFDDMDKSLVDARDLFRNLADLKSLEGSFDYLSENQVNAIRNFWNSFSKDKIPGGQQEFLKFWEQLYGIYCAFRDRLREKRLAYEGMIYREVAGIISNAAPVRLDFDRYVMIGFNALNACEEKLFKYLKTKDKALYYWDYDIYYTASSWHEAGHFIRDNIKRYPAPDPSPRYNNLTGIPKNIYILPVSSFTAQAKTIPSVFRLLELSPADDLRHTAIVLPDERLMMPLISSIPPEIKDINITMGFPLRESSAFSFLTLVIQLFRNALETETGISVFFHRDVTALFKHPFIYSVKKDDVDALMDRVREHNREFIRLDDFLTDDDMQRFIRPVKDAEEAVACLTGALEYALHFMLGNHEKWSGDDNSLELECLYQTYTVVSRLADVLKASGLSFSSGLLFSLVNTMCSGMTVPFSGEPLAGLQVLGILETRLLDFENVIILSMSEGIMPRSLPHSTFIPANLRMGFGMPVTEYHDAVYSYYFYRLIQRAKNIVLIYDESTDGLVTGERSRFIHQLVFEKLFPVREIRMESRIIQNLPSAIVMQKTDRVFERLAAYFSGTEGFYLSPSSINEYLNCPLKFYFHRIASMEETEEVSEEIDPLIFGNILHASMHEIYKPFNKKVVDKAMLASLVSHEDEISNIVTREFRNELYGTTNSTDVDLKGMHLITKEIIAKYVMQIVKNDQNLAPFHVVSLEETYRVNLPLSGRGSIRAAEIRGKVDRIDRNDGSFRIIDYKTGMENYGFRNMESLFSALPGERNDAVFQVFLYAWLYMKNNNHAPVIPCLYFVRSSYKPGFRGFLKDQSSRSEVLDFTPYKDPFEQLLVSALESLADPGVPFIQTTDETYCRHCAYRLICNR